MEPADHKRGRRGANCRDGGVDKGHGRGAEGRGREHAVLPEVPVIAALRATWDGTLWVQRSAEPGSTESGAIDVISPDGRYIGTFPRGSLAMPDAFGPDGLAAFIETDELDVPVITVRRLPVEVR